MEQKFQKGDLAKIRSTGDQVIVLEYKVNHTGGVINAILKEDKYPDSVITDEVLCEGNIAGKFQKKYINEKNLELIISAQ